LTDSLALPKEPNVNRARKKDGHVIIDKRIQQGEIWNPSDHGQ
jgi:hypothetical protein